jgi:zinc and cadmium transporter
MNSDLINIILLSLLGSVIALSGGILFLSLQKFSKVLSKYSIPFASGVLITVSFLGLIPESFHLIGETAFVVMLVSFLGSYFFEMFACDLHHHDNHSCHHHHDGHHHSEGSVPLLIVGDTIHNFIDGVAIAAAYLVNPGLGLITAFSTFLHEVPHEIGDFGILLKKGYSKKNIILINLFSASFTVVGAILIYYFGSDTPLPGYLLAVAAGMFIYLGASDFLPKAHEDIDKKKAVGMLLIGAAVMYLSLSIVPHEHTDGAQEDEHNENVDDSNGEIQEDEYNEFIEYIDSTHAESNQEDQYNL